MSSFGDDPIKDLGFVVFPASAGLDQRDCLFLCFLVASSAFEKTGSRAKVSERSKPTYDFWACVQKD